MGDIQSTIYDYICKANRKIAELSSQANDLLEKTGCNCDITQYVEDINDINSSIYILNKGWNKIELTFGYKNYLTELFPEEDFDAEAATLEIIHAYIDRYSMLDASAIILPLSDIRHLGAGCCSGFSGDLYYNKTEINERFYPLNQNPAGYIVESDLDGLATEEFVNSQGFLTSESDPTVPSHVKNITQQDIDSWDAKLDTEQDPTVPDHVKNITQVNINEWNSKISQETDPTVAQYIKDITNSNITNWNQAYSTTLTLTPTFIPASTFTGINFNKLGGYIVATGSQPLTGANINLSIGNNVAFSRAVIYHQGSSKPSFNGTGIFVNEIGDYIPNQVNEILLFYNGSGRASVIYTNEVDGESKRLISRGTVSFLNDTSLNINGFQWEIDGSIFSSGTINGIPVSERPDNGIRIDSLWGDDNGNVIYVQGSDALNESFIEYPSRVLLSILARKSDGYEHPEQLAIDVNTSTGFIISRVSSNALGHLTLVESRELSKDDVGLDQVDNTSDLDKPISNAVQLAFEQIGLFLIGLEDEFLSKTKNDDTTFVLTLGGLNLPTIPLEVSPSFSLAIMNDGSVVKTPSVVAQDIIDLQDQIDDLQNQINNIEGDKTHTHTQALDSDTWTVDHNLNKRPSISVYDSGNNSVRYEVEFVSLNSVILRFSAPISGTADFN